MKKGDIVLIVFPFTNLSGNKLRPALVLAATAADVTVVFITTQLKWQEHSDIILLPDAHNGIKKASLVRISKIATLDKLLIKGRIGVLDVSAQTHIDNGLASYLQLS